MALQDFQVGPAAYPDGAAVTKSDTTADPAGPFAGLVVTVEGTLKITTLRGTDLTFAAVVVGQYIPYMVQRVWSTGSTSTTLGCKV